MHLAKPWVQIAPEDLSSAWRTVAPQGAAPSHGPVPHTPAPVTAQSRRQTNALSPSLWEAQVQVNRVCL